MFLDAMVTGSYRSSFPKVTAALYVGGAVAHLLRVVAGLPLTEMPFLVDWIVGLAALCGGLGFLLYFSRLVPRTRCCDPLVGLMVFHLLVTALLHGYILAVGSHALLGIFPLAYSAAAAPAFLGFAWLAGTSRVRLAAKA